MTPLQNRSLAVTKPKNLTLKVFLFLISVDLLETLTQFCFKKTALPHAELAVNGATDAFVFVKAVIPSPFLWVGLLSVLLTFIIWSTILSKIDLSVAVPVASFSYIAIPIASIVLLHETIGPLRWSGILLILAGVILVSVSGKSERAHT